MGTDGRVTQTIGGCNMQVYMELAGFFILLLVTGVCWASYKNPKPETTVEDQLIERELYQLLIEESRKKN